MPVPLASHSDDNLSMLKIGLVPKNTQLLSHQILFLLPSTRVMPHPRNANHLLNIRCGSIEVTIVVYSWALDLSSTFTEYVLRWLKHKLCKTHTIKDEELNLAGENTIHEVLCCLLSLVRADDMPDNLNLLLEVTLVHHNMFYFITYYLIVPHQISDPGLLLHIIGWWVCRWCCQQNCV